MKIQWNSPANMMHDQTTKERIGITNNCFYIITSSIEIQYDRMQIVSLLPVVAILELAFAFSVYN